MKQKIQLKPEFVTKTDESGRIPLHWAVSKGEQLEREVVQLGLPSLNYSRQFYYSLIKTSAQAKSVTLHEKMTDDRIKHFEPEKRSYFPFSIVIFARKIPFTF